MSTPRTIKKLPPTRFIKALNSIRTFLIQLNRNLFPGNVVLYEQFQYFWLLPALYVATKLDIASILKDKPLSADKIAEYLDSDPSNIARIMRALSSQGIFKQTKDGRFAINAMAKGLLDEPGSLRYMILHHLGPVNWNLMSNLEFAVRTGKDAFSNRYGEPIYEFLKEHPEENALFDKSMSNLSDLGLAPILNAYDFSKYKVIADIGGGQGFLLANILFHHPHCHGILFDAPQAVAKAPELIALYAVSSRMEIIPGDFFNSIPDSGDLYILKNIIHNWDDDKSLDLLKNIYDAIPQNSRILVIEMVVPTGNEPSLAKLLDIQMMATMQGGKERTAKEFRLLLEKTGFKLIRIIPTIAPISLIEATKTG